MLISKMVKPPEVTIKENEEGHLVRVEEEDTDELVPGPGSLPMSMPRCSTR